LKDITEYFKISPTATGIQKAEISITPIEVTLSKNGSVCCRRINPYPTNRYARNNSELITDQTPIIFIR